LQFALDERPTAQTPPLVGVNAERKEKLRRNLTQSSQSNGTGRGRQKAEWRGLGQDFHPCLSVFICGDFVVLNVDARTFRPHRQALGVRCLAVL